ncbi:MAG: hypothetical protein JNL60_16140 [Bacteroidia bacterium]|nr:hypothetical protein [Bacteroidia bacterium]
MNFQKIALIALLSAGVLFSCKKKDDKPEEETPVVTPTPAPTIAKIKSETMTTNSNGTTVSSKTDYEYDSNGRVIKMTRDDGSYSTLTWGSTQVIQKDFDDNTVTTPASISTYDLNASGLCISQSQGTLGTTATYEYNADGYQTKMTTTNSGQTTVLNFVITNGNQTSMSTTFSGFPMTMTIEYFTDKTNTIGNVNHGMTIFGKDSKNLAKKMSTNVLGQTTASDITYQFDSKNRVSKMSQTQTVSGITTSNSTSYTYFD